jgi:hypothetical protein
MAGDELFTIARNPSCYAADLKLPLLRSGVKELLTLLVKSRQSISKVMEVRFTSGISSASLTFKHRLHAPLSAYV